MKVILDKEMMEKCVLVSPYERVKVNEALNIMSLTIKNVLHEAGDNEPCNLWVLHTKSRSTSTLRMTTRDTILQFRESWNTVIDVCNMEDCLHTPDNVYERQLQLLGILSWFTSWKAIHDKSVVDEEDATTECFFAKETWFCIQALLLSQVATNQISASRKRRR